ITVCVGLGTAIAPVVIDVASSVGAMRSGIDGGVLITRSTLEGPVEKFLAILLGKATDGFELGPVLAALGALAAYIGLFLWYVKQMKKRNKVYEEEKQVEMQ